jgi:cell division protein FtsB
MITRQRKKSVLRRLLMPVVAIGFLSYFGYHAFNDAAQLAVEHDRLVAQRVVLERQVASVRPSSLDADVIDLAARHALNLMRPDEVVISLGAAQQSRQ